MDISDADLRNRLTKFGYDVGPITDTTRSLYQNKLMQFETGKPSPKRVGRKSLDRSQKVGRKSVQNTTFQESTDSPSTRTRRRSVREAQVPKIDDTADQVLSDDDIIKELRRYGFDAGPINSTTRKFYLTKLERLKKGEDPKIRKINPEVKNKSSSALLKTYVDDSSDYGDVESEEEHSLKESQSKSFNSNGKSDATSRLGEYTFLDYSDTIASTVNRSFKAPDSSDYLVKGRRSIGVPSNLPKTPRRSLGNFTPTTTKTPRRATPTPRQTIMRGSGLEGFSDSDGEMLPSSRGRPSTTGINKYILRNRVDRPLETETLDEVDAVQNEQWEQWKREVISVIRRKSQLVITVSVFFLILLFILYCGTKSSEKHMLSLNRSIRNDESIICKDDVEKFDCVKQGNVERAMQLLDPLRGVLEEYSDAFFCGTPDISSPRMPINDVIYSLSTYMKLGEADVKKRMRDLIVFIMHYPHWSIEYGFDEFQIGSEKNPDNVRWLAIKDGSSPVLCWLMSFTSAALRSFALVVTVVTVVIGIFYGLWWLWKNQKSKDAQIAGIVDQVIRILKAQKIKEPGNPYMPVILIQSKVYADLNDRIRNQKLWNEVVDVVEKQQGLIASGNTNIKGIEHLVWWWQGEDVD